LYLILYVAAHGDKQPVFVLVIFANNFLIFDEQEARCYIIMSSRRDTHSLTYTYQLLYVVKALIAMSHWCGYNLFSIMSHLIENHMRKGTMQL